MMNRVFKFTTLVFILAIFTTTYCVAQDAATRTFIDRMTGTRKAVAEIVAETVAESGDTVVVGCGSWISGKKYKDPITGGTSDHDMRVVATGASDEAAMKAWLNVRKKVAAKVRARFGANADKVLRSINIYPPDELMAGVGGVDDAMLRLQELGVNPNLGGATTEGLFGEGGKTFRDAYEASAGRSFWAENGVAKSGFADLLPMGEKAGIYTIGGTANTASQFADKTLNALRAGDAKTLRKNLTRLRSALKLSRSFSSIEPNNYLDDLVRELDGLGKDISMQKVMSIEGIESKIIANARRAKCDAELLRKFANATNPRDVEILKLMLEEGTGRWARLKNTISEASAYVPWRPLIGALMTYFVYLETLGVSAEAGAGDYEAAFSRMLTNVGFAASLPAGMLAMLTRSILDAAQEAGFSLVTRFQNCDDLLAGIYEVKGREQVSDSQKIETNIDQLAHELTTENEVRSIVALHARNAAGRDAAADPSRIAERIELDLNNRCAPRVITWWRARRNEILGDALELVQKIEDAMAAANLTVNYSPDPSTIDSASLPAKPSNVTVTANLAINYQEVAADLKRLNEILLSIGGKQKQASLSVRTRYRWLQNGKEIAANDDVFSGALVLFDRTKGSRTFTILQPGPQRIEFEFGLSFVAFTTVDDVFAVKRYIDRKLSKHATAIVDVYDSSWKVAIKSPDTARVGEPISLLAELSPSVIGLPGLQVIWTNETRKMGLARGTAVNVTAKDAGEQQFKAEVFSEIRGAEIKIGEATKKIKFEPALSKFTVRIEGRDRVKKGEPLALRAIIEGDRTKLPPTAKLRWTLGDKSLGSGDGISYQPSEVGTVQIKVQLVVEAASKRDVLASAVRAIEIYAPSEAVVEARDTSSPAVVGPEQVNATEIFTLEARVPAALLAQGATCSWPRLTKVEEFFRVLDGTGCKRRLQAIDVNDTRRQSVLLWVTLVDKAQKEITSLKHEITILPVRFQAATPETWAGKADEISLRLGRSFCPIPGQEKAEAARPELSASVGAKFCSDCENTLPAIESNLKRLVTSQLRPDRLEGEAVVRPITIGDFSGFALERPAMKRATYSRYMRAGAFGVILLLKGTVVMRVEYSLGGEALMGRDNPDVFYGNCEALYKEILAVLPTIRLTPEGGIGRLTVEPKPVEAPSKGSVRLETTSAGRKLRKGESIDVRAIVEGAKPEDQPLRFVWIGDHEGSGANVRFVATKVGRQKLEVAVEGASRRIGTASAEFEVGAVSATIRRLAADDKILVGRPVSLAAELMPAGGDYILRWEPSTEVHFETNESSSKQTTAVFRKPGRTRVWLSLLEPKGDALETVGESNYLEVDVAPPALAISLSPSRAYVGSAITARVNTTPAVSDIEYRWEIPSAAQIVGESQDTREVTFRVMNNNPIQLIARGRVPGSGESLGEARSTFTGQNYAVSVGILGALGVPPRVWKPGVGLVTIAEGIALNQDVTMRAEVSPVDGRELRYEWALNEDCHFSGGNTGREIRANRSQLGSCIATVIVRDDEGSDLGRGSGTFAATVSPAIARVSSKTAEASEKIKAAKELARKNDFDAAIELADAAVKLDPKNAEASSLVATWRDEIAKAESVKAKSAEIEKLLKQGADQHTARLYTEALATFNRVLDLDSKNLDAFRQRAMAKRELNDLAGSLEDFSRVIDTDPKNYRSFLGRALTKERLDDLKGALADYDRAIQLNPKYANGYWYRGLLRVDRLKDYSGAVDDFSHLIEIEPKNSMAWNNRGIANERLGNLQGAVGDFEKVLEINPDNETAKKNLTNLRAKLANPKPAEKPEDDSIEHPSGNHP